MTGERQQMAERQIHGILQAAITLASDYGLTETEADLVALADKMRKRREYETRKELHSKTPETQSTALGKQP